MVDRLVKAIDFAAKKHANQRRKNSDASPYINHPIDVMNILIECGVNDIDVLIGAVLHDTLEDTNTSDVELVEHFGEKVARIVKECSDDKSLPKHVRKQLQIEHALVISNEAKMIKMADKLSNMSDLHRDPPKGWTKEIVEGYAVWTYFVYLGLRDANPTLTTRMVNLLKTFGVSDETDHVDLKEKLDKYLSLMAK